MSEVLGIPERRRRQRIRSMLLLLAGLVLAALAAVGTYQWASERSTPVVVERPTTPVLVAARAVDARTVVGAADVKVVLADPALVPVGALTRADEAVGRVTAVALAPNEPVLAARIIASSGAPFTVLPTGESLGPATPEYRALSIQLGDANAVGGFVQAGDLIDLIYTIAFEQRVPGGPPVAAPLTANPTERASRIVFEKIAVLAKTGQIYTLRMDAQSAERIAVLQTSEAAVLMLLRAPRDERATRATGATITNEAIPFLRIPGVVR